MADAEHGVYLIFHLLGFGLFFGALVAGTLLEVQLRTAHDAAPRLSVAKSLRAVGFQGPVGILVLLVSGIGLMISKQIGMFSWGWLTAKHIFFAFLVVSGILGALESRRRSRTAGTGNEAEYRKSLRQITLYYLVMALLLVMVLILSVWRP